MEKALIIGDVQAPYHDPSAWEVMLQIGEDLKPDVLVDNGDFPDWRVISTHYTARTEREDLVRSMREEVAIQRGMYKELVKRVRPKKKKKNDGNHEWRVFRMLSQAGPQVLELLGLKGIARAVSVPEILGLNDLGFEYSGEYPNGCWLFNRQPENNVWVEHGYIASQKAGYTASRLIERRMISAVTHHVERLAVVWKKAVGDRRRFGAEGGNLSILAEPGKGERIYSTVPHTAPDYLDHQQGVLVIYQDGNDLYPFPVAIHRGKAVFNGRLYKA